MTSTETHVQPRPLADLIDLTGKVAIVTGGARGIGYGISYRLAEAGAAVLLADIDFNAAEKAAGHLHERGYTSYPCQVDVADEEQVRVMVDAARQELGEVDIVVNDAGIFPQIPIRQMTAGDFDRVISVNLRGLFLVTKYAAEAMIARGQGGRIINITSIDALHPSMVGLAHYDASKHGAWGFTKNAALEYAPYGIWVNAIAPGGVATPGVAAMSTGASGADAEEMVEAFLARIPMHRMGDPDDIGKVALFLASDLASYVTGTQIVVDGGVLLA